MHASVKGLVSIFCQNGVAVLLVICLYFKEEFILSNVGCNTDITYTDLQQVFVNTDEKWLIEWIYLAVMCNSLFILILPNDNHHLISVGTFQTSWAWLFPGYAESPVQARTGRDRDGLRGLSPSPAKGNGTKSARERWTEIVAYRFTCDVRLFTEIDCLRHIFLIYFSDMWMWYYYSSVTCFFNLELSLSTMWLCKQLKLNFIQMNFNRTELVSENRAVPVKLCVVYEFVSLVYAIFNCKIIKNNQDPFKFNIPVNLQRL